MEEIRKSDKISQEDYQNLNKFILLSRFSGNDFTGKTYKEILERIQAFQQQNEDASSREALEKESRRQRLSSFLEINLLKKEFIQLKNKEVLVFTMSLKNSGKEKIKTVSGILSINDLLGKPVRRLEIFLDEDIASGKTFTKTDTLPYHNSDVNDQRIRSKDLVDLRIEWDPEKIILENGKLLQ